MHTEAKMMPGLEKQKKRHLEKAERLMRREDKETGWLNLGKDTVNEPIQDKAAAEELRQ